MNKKVSKIITARAKKNAQKAEAEMKGWIGKPKPIKKTISSCK
ncbi:hypothetical protein [Paenibacillus elgii]|nr:hypothetical protein [Paenibacillus elgii]